MFSLTKLTVFHKIFFFFVCVFACNGTLFSEERDISFDQTIRSLKKGLLLSQKVWVKEGLLRFQRETEQWNSVTIFKENKIYHYFENRHVGTILPYTKKTSKTFKIDPFQLRSPQYLNAYLDSVGAKKIRTETLDNQKCAVFRFFSDNGSQVNTLWLAPNNFPVKSQCKLAQDIITIHYTNVKMNKNIEKELFFIPQNVHFQTVSDPSFSEFQIP